MTSRKTIAALGAACLVATAGVAACSSSPGLSDPREILNKSVTAMQAVKTVHFVGQAAGQMIVGFDSPSPPPSESASASPSGSSSAGASASESASPSASESASASASASPSPTPLSTALPVSLEGAQVEGDIDLANQAASVTGSLPGVPGLSGQLIVVNGQGYSRNYGDASFQMVDVSTLAFNPADPSGPAAYLLSILQIAADPSLQPKLVGMENCQEGRCYHVSVTLTPDVVNSKLSGMGESFGGGQLDVWVLQGSFDVARLEYSSSDPRSGSIALRLLLTRFDKPVTILAPPPAQLATPAPSQ